MSETYHCWYPLQIRFRDLDPLAHVNNSVYFIYFEEARSHYFNQLTPWLKQWPAEKEHQQSHEEETTVINDSESETPNPRIRTDSRGRHYGILVKEATCTYEIPLVRSDQAEVGIRVTHIGRSSIVIEHEIRATNEHTQIFARGRTVMVWSNYYTGRSHPVPQSLRNAFEQMEQRTF